MIVEFVGPPGAGKTTLIPTARSFFREQGILAYTVVEAARPITARTLSGRLLCRVSPSSLEGPLLWRLFLFLSFLYRLRFMAAHASLVRKIMRWQAQRPADANIRQRKVSFWLFRLMGYYEFLGSKLGKDECLILDEGFLHRAVQLFTSSVEKPEMATLVDYTNQIPRPDLVVSVYASRQTCLKRIYGRGLWDSFQDKPKVDVARFVDHAHLASSFAVRCGRRLGWTILEIDNDASGPGQARAMLREHLFSLLTTRTNRAHNLAAA